MTLTVIDSTKKVGKSTHKTRNLYKDSKGKWFMDCGRCEAIRPYDDFHQLKRGWHRKHSCCKYCKSEIKRIDKQKKAKQLKEQRQNQPQPQPKAGIEKRNLSVNLDIGIWKAVQMQAIMEDVPADVLVEKMVLYYLAKTENNVLKL